MYDCKLQGREDWKTKNTGEHHHLPQWSFYNFCKGLSGWTAGESDFLLLPLTDFQRTYKERDVYWNESCESFISN